MSPISEYMPQTIDIANDLDPAAFDAALAKTRRGDKIIYHRGAHAGGRHKGSAMLAQEAGLVALVQGRIDKTGVVKFVYIAQRTGKKFA